MRANWEEAVRQVEGRPDAEENAIALITVHAAKGLEWPVVIPINMTGRPYPEIGVMHDRRKDSFSIPLLGIHPAGYRELRSWNGGGRNPRARCCGKLATRDHPAQAHGRGPYRRNRADGCRSPSARCRTRPPAWA
jgi:hypothetical protein